MKNPSKHRQIYESLRTAITNGTYPPGFRLRSLRELAKIHGVSTQPVRTALDLLREDGLVYQVHGDGTYVMKKQKTPRVQVPRQPERD
jgi:DNA-binding GntR family transcriptional regulator